MGSLVNKPKKLSVKHADIPGADLSRSVTSLMCCVRLALSLPLRPKLLIVRVHQHRSHVLELLIRPQYSH